MSTEIIQRCTPRFNETSPFKKTPDLHLTYSNQRTNGPLNAHLISWPSKVQNIQNLENIW